MSALTKMKARLRTESTAGLPRLLKLYARDDVACKLIRTEIQHRQQMAAKDPKNRSITLVLVK